MKLNKQYQVLIGINEKPLLNIIYKHFPKEEIFSDDGFFYGVVVLDFFVKNRDELLSYLYDLQIYEEDIIRIKKEEVKK
tara:strand:- start:37 stop:273 length:237 start_codon:yes stop_codon:yes gene_type:complete